MLPKVKIGKMDFRKFFARRYAAKRKGRRV